MKCRYNESPANSRAVYLVLNTKDLNKEFDLVSLMVYGLFMGYLMLNVLVCKCLIIIIAFYIFNIPF